MKIVLNAVSAKMGGAANYIKNLARELAALDLDDEFIFFVPEEQAQAIRGLAANIRVEATEVGSASFVKRLWFDQVTLRRWLKREKADALYSTANFGMMACPCQQVLLVRNALYFSTIYQSNILPRKSLSAKADYWLRRWLIVKSVKWADWIMTPTQAMLDDLQRVVQITPDKGRANHYGTSIQPSRNAYSVKQEASSKHRKWRLFYSSLYAEHKNLRTLLQSLILLPEKGVSFQFITSADPNWQGARGTVTGKIDAALLADNRLKDHVEFTGILSSEQMADQYKMADLFVYPSVIESFGHPLIEAMASGIPIVAADAPVNRELCQDAALYFEAFDLEDCTKKIAQAMSDEHLRKQLIACGLQRSKQFAWNAHINRLLKIFNKLIDREETN